MTNYHYTECGLQNVFIDGMKIVIDDEGDEIVTISYINELHKMIALGVVSHKHGISGDELRFLRTEMGYTQAELAGLVHHDRQSIGRWERSEFEIDSSAEAIIRRLSIEKLALDSADGIDALSKYCVPSVSTQPINIKKNDNDNNVPYELVAA